MWVGIFVGGQSRRMGGFPKGLLEAPGGQSLVQRLVSEAQRALPEATICLVGEHPAYAPLGLPQIADAPAGIGPLGGLLGLLGAATTSRVERLLVMSCDLPFVRAPLMERLVAFAPEAAAVAPLDRFGEGGGETRWQPFFARYRVAPSLAAASALHGAGGRSLQQLFSRLPGAVELPLSPEERAQLRDWDTPEDRRLG